ncbi:MAG: hypothetical protein KME45_23255 [Stenomitos rutilans HA7619-LM2]|jgi:hypothetical protein|nr:hypothetical protein [Stenomitos rutilans HA7619-LM2]
MALSLELTTLRSRKENAKVEATRAVAKATEGLLPKLKKFLGWGFSAVVNYFNLSFSNLWDMFVQAYFAIKTFDFGATDKALEEQIERNNQQLVTRAAEALGETLGFQSVRLANAFLGRFFRKNGRDQAAKMKIPILTAEIGLALAEEGNEELQANVKRLLQGTISAQVSNAFINTVLAARKNHWFGLNSITTPQADGSIAQKIEKKIEQLPKFWQQPVEEFIEGFEEGIIEAGYIVTMKIDDHVAANRYAQNRRGVERYIEIPVEPQSDEKLQFAGSQAEVVDLVKSATMTTIPLVKNRDIGQVFAEPVDEQIKPKVQLRKVVFNFSEYSKPPYRRKGKLGTHASIAVPDAKPGLGYEKLRSTLDGYTRGNCYCTCQMDNGRQMAVYASTETEGKKVLRTLASLSTADLIEETFRSSQAGDVSKKIGIKQMHIQSASLLYPKKKNGKLVGANGKSVTVKLFSGSPPVSFEPFI